MKRTNVTSIMVSVLNTCLFQLYRETAGAGGIHDGGAEGEGEGERKEGAGGAEPVT